MLPGNRFLLLGLFSLDINFAAPRECKPPPTGWLHADVIGYLVLKFSVGFPIAVNFTEGYTHAGQLRIVKESENKSVVPAAEYPQNVIDSCPPTTHTPFKNQKQIHPKVS